MYCGKQKLSWHGTTIQAIQPLPHIEDDQTVNRRRAWESHSPPHSPLQKRHRVRARTGTELSNYSNSTQLALSDTSYHFEDASNYVPQTVLKIDMFRPLDEERSALLTSRTRLLHFCLLKDIYQINKDQILEKLNLEDMDANKVEMANMQEFCTLYDKDLQPDVADVVYVNVLDERADDKDTVLHVVNQLYTEHVCKQGKRFLVLERDAKTYEIIQNLKEEYGKDLSWLYAYPGDWHLLKNYQHCLMKPFFEAGLKELADYVGYPSQSIQSCSIFKRTHHFLMEIWESMYRHIIKLFLSYGANAAELQCPKDITHKVLSTLKQLTDERYDHKAITCIVKL